MKIYIDGEKKETEILLGQKLHLILTGLYILFQLTLILNPNIHMFLKGIVGFIMILAVSYTHIRVRRFFGGEFPVVILGIALRVIFQFAVIILFGMKVDKYYLVMGILTFWEGVLALVEYIDNSEYKVVRERSLNNGCEEES